MELTVIQGTGEPSNNAITAKSPQSGTGCYPFWVFFSSLKLKLDISPMKNCVSGIFSGGISVVIMQMLIMLNLALIEAEIRLGSSGSVAVN